MRYLSVPNFEKWQHYKDRTPPWIKLHREVLRNYDFSLLADQAKAHLMLIWLLASQLDNRIPNDPSYVQRMIGSSGKPDLNLLIERGFLNSAADCEQVASDMQADCTNLSHSGETETEAETDNSLPPWLPTETWDAYMEVRRKLKSPNTDKAISLLIGKLSQLRDAGYDPQKVIEQSIERGWRSFFQPKGDNYEKPRRQHAPPPSKDDRARAAVMRAALAGGFAPTAEP